MQFKTTALSNLPQRTAFGKEPIFTDADVADAAKALRTGVAISDGELYATRAAAHNRAGVLRARLRKTVPNMVTGSTAVADGDQWRWWIRPEAKKPEQVTEKVITTKTRTK